MENQDLDCPDSTNLPPELVRLAAAPDKSVVLSHRTRDLSRSQMKTNLVISCNSELTYALLATNDTKFHVEHNGIPTVRGGIRRPTISLIRFTPHHRSLLGKLYAPFMTSPELQASYPLLPPLTHNVAKGKAVGPRPLLIKWVQTVQNSTSLLNYDIPAAEPNDMDTPATAPAPTGGPSTSAAPHTATPTPGATSTSAAAAPNPTSQALRSAAPAPNDKGKAPAAPRHNPPSPPATAASAPIPGEDDDEESLHLSDDETMAQAQQDLQQGSHTVRSPRGSDDELMEAMDNHEQHVAPPTSASAAAEAHAALQTQEATLADPQVMETPPREGTPYRDAVAQDHTHPLMPSPGPQSGNPRPKSLQRRNP